MNFKKVSDNLSTIVIIIALVGGVVGANNYFATASDPSKRSNPTAVGQVYFGHKTWAGAG